MKRLVIICFIAIFISGTMILLKLPVSKILPYGILLLCSLMHIFMMKRMHNKKEKDKENSCH